MFMSKGLFVVGTGTDIGKTYVTGLLLKYIRDNGYNATYFKAALSGAIKDENDSLVPGDAVEVLTMVGLEEDTDFLVPYIYETAVSPHLASQIEGNPVDLGVVKDAYEKVSQKYDYIVMEGSGGIVCPIRYEGQDNENNIIDGLFARNFKNLSFVKAIKENDFMQFTSAQTFDDFMNNPAVSREIKDRLMDRINVYSARNFRNIL